MTSTWYKISTCFVDSRQLSDWKATRKLAIRSFLPIKTPAYYRFGSTRIGCTGVIYGKYNTHHFQPFKPLSVNSSLSIVFRYYNGGERPKKEVIDKHPELLHTVRDLFGVHNLGSLLYNHLWPQWRQMKYTIHLLYGQRQWIDPYYNFTQILNETNVHLHPKTIRNLMLSALVPVVMNDS